MSVTLDSTWGPYRSQSDALFSLGRFANRACGPGIGLAWSTGGMLYPLRNPVYDGDGFGDVLTIEWNPPSPHATQRQAAPPPDLWHRLVRVIERGLEMQAEAQMAEAQAYMAMANSLANSRLFNHASDGVGVAIDAIGVVVTILLLPAASGVALGLGIAALVGGSVLLLSDGTIYGMEMSGHDEGAEKVRKITEPYRIGATILTLPDLAMGGYKAVAEAREASELLQADRATAQSADSMGARMANKMKAQKYAEIAERAHLRAQIRLKQIQASLALEISPRAAGGVGVGLLLREEITSDDSVLNQVASWLRMHIVTVRK